jgi:hypothetical protein
MEIFVAVWLVLCIVFEAVVVYQWYIAGEADKKHQTRLERSGHASSVV